MQNAANMTGTDLQGKAEERKLAEISMVNGNGKRSLSCQEREVRMELWKPRRESVERKDKVGRKMTKVRDGDQWRYK